MGLGRKKRPLIARRAAHELQNGMIVNLGIGIPTMVADFVPEGIHVVFQAENGILRYGTSPREGEEDPFVCNAGGLPVTLMEAFAAQSLAVIKELGLDPEKVNVNGGAIALGHPVGATGPKLTISLINELIRRNQRYGLVTLCMAGGMGMAVVFENLRYDGGLK
ncbi:MAG: CoA-transferase [Clostridia bacterium]|nr:CoA-transferase [Clostridia bacterium]